MTAQTLPSSAEAYDRRQRREIVAALAALRRQWRRMGPDFDTSWSIVSPTLLAIVTTAQRRLVAEVEPYMEAVLEETAQRAAITPYAAATTAPLINVAGDGRELDTLLYGAVTHAKTRIDAGATVRQALHGKGGAGQWLTLASGTALSDTSRQAEALHIGVRPVGGYVRMLEPPSCSRCVVMAGQWYRKNTGFPRHPGCDCRHIPASESVGGDFRVNATDYFDSLDEAEQDRVFTKAGAEAIRAGADPAKVVNARRGMTKSQSGRLIRDESGLYRTTEGLGRGRRRRSRPPRLMPESIAQVAKDRDDYLRLLRANGYLLA